MDFGSASRIERQDLAEIISTAKSGSYSAAARNDIAVGDPMKLLCLVRGKTSFLLLQADISGKVRVKLRNEGLVVRYGSLSCFVVLALKTKKICACLAPPSLPS